MAKSTTFPFNVHRVEDIQQEEANWKFSIQAPVGDLESYQELFDEFGFEGNGYSWAEHIRFILSEADGEIDNHLDYDEEADTFLVGADSQETVDRFMKHILPIFATKKSLKKYLSQADPDNFEE